jgi:hypothetical protein
MTVSASVMGGGESGDGADPDVEDGIDGEEGSDGDDGDGDGGTRPGEGAGCDADCGWSAAAELGGTAGAVG